MTSVSSGIATREATEAAASVKSTQQFRLSRPEIWHPEFSTQMLLLDSITVQYIIESMAVEAGPEPTVEQSS